MIARYNNLSLLLGVPGFILQIVGNVMRMNSPNGAALGYLLLLAGTALLIAGLAYYAVAKRQNPAWCLMGFLSLIGIIVLACLPDRAPNG
jgi:hypothetical protein